MPEPVGEDDDVVGVPALLVGGLEQGAAGGPEPQEGEERGRGLDASHPFASLEREAAPGGHQGGEGGDGWPAAPVRRDPRDLRPAPVEVVEPGDGEVVALAVDLPQADEAVGVGGEERPEHQRVAGGEGDGRRGEGQGQGGDRESGEDRRGHVPVTGEPEVQAELGEALGPAQVAVAQVADPAALDAHPIEVAEPGEGRRPRRRRLHAAG